MNGFGNIFCGVIFVITGLWLTLAGFHMLPKRLVESDKSKKWHEKYDKLMKFLGPIQLVGGILLLAGLL